MTESRGESIVIDTPDGIASFRLAALKGALNMQANFGMQLSRGHSATKVVKRDYGLKGTAKIMLPIVEQELADLQALRHLHPDDLNGLMYLLQLCLNAEADADKTIEEAIKDVLAEQPEENRTEVGFLFEAALRVYRFESKGHPAAAVLFRSDG